MLKIAVIGGRDTVMGFKALGLEEEYAIIYIEENLAAEMQNEIAKFKDSPSPAIILIPGREGSIGLGLQALHDAVERAVGTNILGD